MADQLTRMICIHNSDAISLTHTHLPLPSSIPPLSLSRLSLLRSLISLSHTHVHTHLHSHCDDGASCTPLPPARCRAGGDVCARAARMCAVCVCAPCACVRRVKTLEILSAPSHFLVFRVVAGVALTHQSITDKPRARSPRRPCACTRQTTRADV
jgi:hypothetical protein